jgi:SAM-dependent methyltransferase
MSLKKKIYSSIKSEVNKMWRRVLRYSGDEVSYVYDEEFATKPWRDKGYTGDFKNIVMNFYDPENIVDIGCGTGDFLMPFLNEGVDVLGVDGSEHCFENRKIPKDKFLVKDVRFEEIELGSFDVCLCMEVAEHIEEKFSERLIKVITNLSPVIVFTAATPGQGGVDHVNEKPHEWWVNKFQKKGYRYEENKSSKFSEMLASIEHSNDHDRRSIKNYEKNIMLFEGY